jgi:acylphosphatase
MDDRLEARLVRVEGRVQGVGYREACVQQAMALGVSGWVRNRRDGSVEVMLQGPAHAVVRLQTWLSEGPPAARVDRVTVTSVAMQAAQPARFERLPTA